MKTIPISSKIVISLILFITFNFKTHASLTFNHESYVKSTQDLVKSCQSLSKDIANQILSNKNHDSDFFLDGEFRDCEVFVYTDIFPYLKEIYNSNEFSIISPLFIVQAESKLKKILSEDSISWREVCESWKIPTPDGKTETKYYSQKANYYTTCSLIMKIGSPLFPITITN